MKVYLIRHGESVANAEDRINADHGLSDAGRTQCLSVKVPSVHKVFCSTLLRARESAELLYPDTEIEFSDLLQEKRNGSFEGMKHSEVDWSEINKEHFMHRKAPGGESLSDVVERVQAFLSLLNTLDCESVAIISHGTFIRVFLRLVAGEEIDETLWERAVGNCEVIEIEI